MNPFEQNGEPIGKCFLTEQSFIDAFTSVGVHSTEGKRNSERDWCEGTTKSKLSSVYHHCIERELLHHDIHGFYSPNLSLG